MAEFSQKVVNQYLLKSDIFKNGPKVAKYLVYFYKKNCHQDLSKMAQSGHTDLNVRGCLNLMQEQ